MNCPDCRSDTRVLDTRERSDKREVRRRRECLVCKCRFSTIETDEGPVTTQTVEEIEKLGEVLKAVSELQKELDKRLP